MTEGVLERIKKLVALALNNPSEAEAHAAAMKALRMMVEHKVRISLPVATRTAPKHGPVPAGPGFPPGWPSTEQVDDFIRRAKDEREKGWRKYEYARNRRWWETLGWY